MLEKEPKQGKKFQYLRIYNLEKIWSRIHQVFGPEFTWSRKYLVPNSPLGPEFTWSRIHLVPNSPDTTRCPVYQEERETCVNQMKMLIDKSSNPTVWNNHITSRAALVKLIMDNSVFINVRNGRRKHALIHQLESMSRNLCYRIHNKRLISLDAIS